MKEIRGYKCDYCGKVYQKKHNAEIHEKLCSRNPENHRPCFGCANLDKVKYKYYSETSFGNECLEIIYILKCTKKEIYLYPPKVEYKGNAFSLDDINEPMPKVCDDRIDMMQEFLNGDIL